MKSAFNATRLIALGLVLGCLFWHPAFAQMPNQACQAVKLVSPSTATDTQIVAPIAGRNVFVCALEASSDGTNNFYLESATAASCGGSLAQIGTEFYTVVNWFKNASTYLPGLNTGVGNGLCVHTTGSVALSLTVWYAQHP